MRAETEPGERISKNRIAGLPGEMSRRRSQARAFAGSTNKHSSSFPANDIAEDFDGGVFGYATYGTTDGEDFARRMQGKRLGETRAQTGLVGQERFSEWDVDMDGSAGLFGA